jgi:DNA-binding MarR family transcriptional regulator
MPKDRDAEISTKLDTLTALMRHLLVLKLAEGGATQQAIAKHIRASKSTVVEMLQGVRYDG